MTDSNHLTYGEVLRELRTFYGFKQKDISALLNITSQAYSNYETNKRTSDIESMRRIAEFYNLTLDELVGYRTSSELHETRNYAAKNTQKKVFRGVTKDGLVIPLTAEQAKLVQQFLTLSPEQQHACQDFINLIK